MCTSHSPKYIKPSDYIDCDREVRNAWLSSTLKGEIQNRNFGPMIMSFNSINYTSQDTNLASDQKHVILRNEMISESDEKTES